MKPEISIESLVRPNIRKLKPYRSARDDYDSGLLLDANENSMGAPYQKAEGLHRYPSPYQLELRKRIANLRNLSPENVFVGVGSDEAIDLLYRIFCEPRTDNVIITPPTYGMYKVSAGIHDVSVKKVNLDSSFQPKVDEILEAVDEQTKMLFLCSPNNPTGNEFEQERIEVLIDRFPGIVVIDEAYIDFSERESRANLIENNPNLVVLQTLSKSFGMAGVRMGIALSSEEINRFMMKVKAPYNVNALTSKYALEAFDHRDTISFHIEKLVEEREKLRRKLQDVPGVRKIYPSDANFLLVKFDNAIKLYKELADKEIIVRYRGDEPLCENCLRITVGTPDENEQLINTLKELV
ncbi:histidinol-phosphate transaminase [Balneolaceae bacterium YR4-1]|uniref:Histidinol-phosphate aminotransferase n=1 Tax=Halalkalibaculum roseum TaxID=2709311 RepID=A0A6M1SYS1_9BACT|nr:histidinol-phosphate transaminase [Halalkalibaculum roseum]NGP75707.1 histidinol-phosphate transaminase [Halalkalibaculum roseum]